jgi:site-specific DNA-cytosine methylase
MQNKEMDVLSLFDGMACCQIALNKAGIKYKNYYSSEIDKYAIQVTQHNYPNTIQLGDINNWREWDIDFEKIGLISAGSPCFTAGNLVMTNEGYVPIEYVKVGSKV